MARRKPRKDTRLNRDHTGEARADRRLDDREVVDDRVLTDDQRLDEFRRATFQSVLPDLLPIDGYHVCWLTTTNPRDSIPARMRLGYEPIKPHEMPGWEHAHIKSGEYEGLIGIEEMVAFKLPIHLYEAYMYEAHHRQPAEQEASINEMARQAQEEAMQVNSRRSTLEAEEGMEFGEVPEPPSFEETAAGRL